MRPMSLSTFDTKALQQMSHDQALTSPGSPGCEKAERWLGQAAVVAVGLALLAVLLVS